MSTHPPETSAQSSPPQVYARGSVIGCRCPRVVRRPYRTNGLVLFHPDGPAIALEPTPGDGSIRVWHRDGCELEVTARVSR